MRLAAAIKTLIPRRRIFARYVKALAVSSVLLFAAAQQSFGADCSKIVEALARLKCFDRAADARLPKPKGARLIEPPSREERIRKFGGHVSK
jgi:hypothetical protein